jgi:predicted phage terminase large subunit-like protein
MSKNETVNLADVLKIAVDLGRRSFYAYCRLRMPFLYTPKHEYLKDLCEQLQSFVEDRLLDDSGKPYQKMIINMPPRTGKTVTVILLCQWLLGKYPDKTSIITASYNETLSARAAKGVRDSIMERKAEAEKLVFTDFFPGVKIKDGDAAMQLWSLEGRHFSYLATSPGGTLTGVGAKLLLLDDLIKNYSEACNERILDEHWDWYTNTVLSRLESGAKRIMIMTRWATGDLCGRVIAKEPGEWYVVKKKAHDEKLGMLADDILSLEEYEARKKVNDRHLIMANYQQEPFDSDDKLYGIFKTYTAGLLPKTGRIEAVVDTADEGSDYLAAIVYLVENNTAYVLDVVYTQAPMEKTEGMVALSLASNKVRTAWVESNSGGRGFARNVERILRESAGYTGCFVKWYHQGENKVARIVSNSTSVTNTVVFPEDWKARWPEFFYAVTGAGRQEKWVHDDAMDALTMVVEKSLTSGIHVADRSVRDKLGL